MKGRAGTEEEESGLHPNGEGGEEEESAELFTSSDKGTAKGDQSEGGGMEV